MSQVTSITFSWKSYDVDLAQLNLWMIANIQHFCGASADKQLHLWFTAPLGTDAKAAVEQHWNSLTEETEAVKIALREKLKRVLAYAAENLPALEYSAMGPAERKMFMRRDLTTQDLMDLAYKYSFVN